jgi:hypothetical protein
MKNIATIHRFFTVFCLLIFSITKSISAQIVIGKPSLGFSQACAGPSFNTYYATFSFSPESGLGATNQFVIELSDASGNFENPTVIYTSNQGAVTTSPATLGFSLPDTTSGETFKLRIISTVPAATSSNSVAFAAYYKIQDSPFSINNLISTGAYCSGGSYLITIDNPGSGSNDSPLQYPSLTFNWFKETGPTTSVFVTTGETLSVNQPGTYFVETNYGTCTSDSFSNRVTISAATSGITSSINSSLGNPYCSSAGPTTLSAINGNSYKWFKDGSEISGATDQMYQTNEAGSYTVTVDLGDCVSSASIDLENKDFTSSIDVLDTNILETNETLVATVSTTANNPEFKWYLNDVFIPNALGNSYEATQSGNYKVMITQSVGCMDSIELMFLIYEPVSNIPNLISPNNDGFNDTWIIPHEFLGGTNTKILILSSQGEVEFETDNYQNNWPENQLDFKDINPVYYYIITMENNKVKKGSITVVK